MMIASWKTVHDRHHAEHCDGKRLKFSQTICVDAVIVVVILKVR
jgi:hypothetical protein